MSLSNVDSLQHFVPEILISITILVLLYTLVMTLTWLREQPSLSLISRPYAVASANDESEATNQVLSIVRGWMTTASDSAESIIDSTPVQTIKDTTLSVIADFRDLLMVQAIVPRQSSLWTRYLPSDQTRN